MAKIMAFCLSLIELSKFWFDCGAANTKLTLMVNIVRYVYTVQQHSDSQLHVVWLCLPLSIAYWKFRAPLEISWWHLHCWHLFLLCSKLKTLNLNTRRLELLFCKMEGASVADLIRDIQSDQVELASSAATFLSLRLRADSRYWVVLCIISK